jgi:hypothetical protein
MFDPQFRENCGSILIPAFDPDARSAADQNKQRFEARSRQTFDFTYPYRMWIDSYGILIYKRKPVMLAIPAITPV